LRRAFLVAVSLFGRMEEGLPKTGLFQDVSIVFPYEGSLDQNSSNLKGLGRKREWLLVFRDMGLWFEL
jgi:hypothetical protein